MPEISIKPETIFHIFGFPITNSLFTASIVVILFFFLAIHYYTQSKKKKKSGLYYVVHFIVHTIYQMFESILGDKIMVIFPLLFSFFMFIILQNWFGLLPGVGSILVSVIEHGEKMHFPLFRGGNADLNTTFALALISVGAIQFYGVKYLGINYFKKFLNFTNPINFFLGILEIVSEFSKVLSFSFRLFGNVFAGEVLLTIVAFLVPVLASFPFIILEVFVGFVQALVFSMLTAVFISGAVTAHH
ncbi:ATP synthase F0 subunit A [Microgenomates bacterium UTCPR1]|nr:MAG: ATP synthase F0 subunit A [Microgenomates bacterium UTCPR1]